MKTGHCPTEREGAKRSARRGSLALVALLSCASHWASAQDLLGFADYQNVWYTTSSAVIPGLGNVASTSTLSYQGHLTSPPLSEVVVPLASFGQPVGGQTFFGADYRLGEEIRVPDGCEDTTPMIHPPTHAFYVSTARKVFAGDYGLVSITWKKKGGGSQYRRYVISNRPTQAPVIVYHNTGLTTGTQPFFVDLSRLRSVATSVTIHHNAHVTSQGLWIDNDRLRARGQRGQLVLHYDEEGGTRFAGVQIVEVRPQQPSYVLAADVGQILTPRVTRPDALSSPTICRGHENPAEPFVHGQYVYQYPSSKAEGIRGQVFAVRPASTNNKIRLYWTHLGRYGVQWPYELTAYTANWPAGADWQWIYQTGDGSLGPPVGEGGMANRVTVPIVAFFYNEWITSTGTIELNQYSHQIVAPKKTNETGRILLLLDDGGPGRVDLEFVELKAFLGDPRTVTTSADVGSRLWPSRTDFPLDSARPAETFVRMGYNGNPNDANNYAYLHKAAGDYDGAVFAVRPNPGEPHRIEVYFKREGKKGLLWPCEKHYYETDWPEEVQLFVRGTVRAVPGPEVAIPEQLNPQLMPYQEYTSGAARLWVEHAALTGNRFASDLSTRPPGDYYALLLYQTGPQAAIGSEWVGFEVVRSIQHTDPLFEESVNPKIQWTIGQEITAVDYHEGPYPGYIYHVPGEDVNNKYDPRIYNQGGTGYASGQIFPVFPGTLHVWWSNETTHGLKTANVYSVYWPSTVRRYNCQLPDGTVPKLVIASEESTPVLAGYQTPEVYFQNDPGAVGYCPNYEHALIVSYQSGDGSPFALRRDLNAGSDKNRPYVLCKYRDATDLSRWRFVFLDVVATDTLHPFFGRPATAGIQLALPVPLCYLPVCPASDPEAEVPDGNHGFSGPYWRDRDGNFWAKAALDTGGQATIVMRYFYPRQASFVFPDAADNDAYAVGEPLAWLDRLGAFNAVPPTEPGKPGTPVDYVYATSWPETIPRMKIGETLVVQKPGGLPNIIGQESVEVIYETVNHDVIESGDHNVRLIDPIHARVVDLTDDQDAAFRKLEFISQAGARYLSDLPPHLRRIVRYNPAYRTLELEGEYVPLLGGEGVLLLNVLTARDRDILKASLTAALADAKDQGYVSAAVDALYNEANKPLYIPADRPTNSAGKALIAVSDLNPYRFPPTPAYVTLAMQNHTSLTSPVSLEILQVTRNLYRGQIVVIYPDCCFDERVTLRHNGDFAGKADDCFFVWEYHRTKEDGTDPTTDSAGWLRYEEGLGLVDVTIQGTGFFTLSDKFFRCKYYKDQLWSEYTDPQLVEGWIKRVLGDIDPFKQRATGGGIQGAEDKFSDFQNRTVNTIVTMIGQAGKPWIGNVPMNCNPEVIDNLGLIEIYETVLGRGKDLSVNAGYSDPDCNNALLLAAGRIADLYMLVGNEAYADASDSTIAFGTEDQEYGTFASSIHCFMNQTASLLEEELALLRGRDDTRAPGVQTYPLYNRLMWNFTRDITGGEVAYALNYNIQDNLGNVDGTIDELDAMKLYPQGHGDAWGHYLTAIKRYYDLLKHPNFDWVPRAEQVLVGGKGVTVDYMDERKFAKAAAAKAKTGAEIVNLSYRAAYVEDPEGQWQGYKDTNVERAWGLSEWANRAGVGAYCDWLAANAILPDMDTVHTGIAKVDRTTVMELREITVAYDQIQALVDQADVGLNPLGLAKNVVPFDIDPNWIIVPPGQFWVGDTKTHFEQVYERALIALENAVTAFNYAANCTQLLRRQADSLNDFQRTVQNREFDFNSRLIEIFGYPYSKDPDEPDLNGPDLIHYDYVDANKVLGESPGKTETFKITFFDKIVDKDDGSVTSTPVEVTYHISEKGFGPCIPEGADWGTRRATGEIQQARSQLLQQYGRYRQLLADYDGLTEQIEEMSDLLEAHYQLKKDTIGIRTSTNDRITELRWAMFGAELAELRLKRAGTLLKESNELAKETVPKSILYGLAGGGDILSAVRAGIKAKYVALFGIMTLAADAAKIAQTQMDLEMDIAREMAIIEVEIKEAEFEVRETLYQLKALILQESAKRLEILTQCEVINGAMGEYQAAIARGLRLWEERDRFREQTAGQIQDYRYKDMAFRIFRNDMLQKYRAQFDLAARYCYLAAKAYDYETNLLGSDGRAGQHFMTSIVRSRSLGSFADGAPLLGAGVGDPGLADIMARMKLNWDLALKGQLGFNNPQTETNRFSLKYELFRTVDDATWEETLRRHRVDNLLGYRDFNRYCRVFYPHLAEEPAIVIPISTTVNFGFNFFRWPLAGGDSAYDSTNFATKVRSVGVWFENYDALTSVGLSRTPRVYLVPVGQDIMRSPTGESGDIRLWKILDQKLPVPFPVGESALAKPDWIPTVDTLSEDYAAIRRYSSFRAFHDAGFDESQMTMDSRLVGRSVWNTRWLLIIPMGTLHANREYAYEKFVQGIDDIKIFFQTYAYSGN